MKKVFLLTYCKNSALAWSSTLTLDTLRIGFPDAEVFVVDNNSIPEVRPLIREKALGARCHYRELDTEIFHHDFIADTLRANDGCVIFLDPDLCFWESCEGWEIADLFGGRHLPAFYDEFSKTVTMERLHTSFLWIPDAAKLRERLEDMRSRFFEFEPIRPFMFKHDKQWYRYDTTANLYAAFKSDTYSFRAGELSCYDHLFCGTHLNEILPRMDRKSAGELERFHDTAKRDIRQIKGTWRLQDIYFAQRRPSASQEFEPS
jgi:hypothetical protein